MADQAAAAHALAPTESSTAVAVTAVTATAAIATATTTASSSPHRAAVVGKAEVPKTAFPAIDKVLAMMRTRLDIPARAPPPESDDDDYGDYEDPNSPLAVDLPLAIAHQLRDAVPLRGLLADSGA